MSNIEENRAIDLKEIVNNIKEGQYLIPQFQRNFVWKVPAICELGDSLIRGYPISSLLMIPKDGALHKLPANNINNQKNIQNKEIAHHAAKYLILDGQQRMVSISRLFLNYDPKDEFYFDLLSMLCEKYPEDNIQYQENIKNFSLKESELNANLCRKFKLQQDSCEKPARNNYRYISCKKVIQQEYSYNITKFLKVFEQGFSENNIGKYSNYLNSTFGDLANYKINVTMIHKNSELGLVIRVFEKINSSGIKLTLFDLINAKSFQSKCNEHKDGLSTYLNNKILQLIEKNNYDTSGVNNFFDFDQHHNKFKKIAKISRILEISYLLKKDQTPSLMKPKMLNREPEFWFNQWDEHGDFLLSIINWIQAEQLNKIAQDVFLEYAVAIFLANPKAFEYKQFKHEIKKYALYLQISGANFSKSNINVIQDFYNISTKITDHPQNEKYKYESPVGKTAVKTNDILELAIRNAKSHAISNIFYIEKIKDLFVRDIVGYRLEDFNRNKYDHHHIFPRSKVRSSKKKLFDSIANIVLLDSNINRFNIKDQAPNEYLPNLKESNPNIEQDCQKNLIDYETACLIQTAEDAEIFIKNRAQKIAETVNSYFD